MSHRPYRPKIHRQIAMPMLVIGSAQWIAQGFWWFKGGVWVEISIRRMLAELFDVAPSLSGVAGDLLAALLSQSPGTLMIGTGLSILVGARLHARLVERRNRRLTGRKQLAGEGEGVSRRWTRVDFRSAS